MSAENESRSGKVLFVAFEKAVKVEHVEDEWLVASAWAADYVEEARDFTLPLLHFSKV